MTLITGVALCPLCHMNFNDAEDPGFIFYWLTYLYIYIYNNNKKKKKKNQKGAGGMGEEGEW